MKKLFFAVLLLSSVVVSAQDLVILHTNDLHSHLNGLSPELEYTPLISDNDPTLGGFARIGGFIKSEREKQGDKLLVVNSGDFLMGTFFQTLETSEGFQLNLMKKMGYDFVSVGNHEFDFGPNQLAAIIKNSKSNGEIPQLLLSNYKSAETDDQNLKALINDETILPYKVIEKNGHRIGIFALVGIDAMESVPSKYGVKFYDPIKTAKTTAQFLRKTEKVDLVMVLSHCGVKKNDNGEWYDEDIELGEKVSDIDLIISGHSHTILKEELKAGNAIVVQAGELGKHVGRVEVSFLPNGKPDIHYTLLPMDDQIAADAEIQQLIDAKIPILEKNILSQFDISYSKPVVETSFELFMDEKNPIPSNLGPLVADAIYSQLNSTASRNVDVAMVAAGVIRSNFFVGKTGAQSINDIFNVMPLGEGFDDIPGNPLAKIYITGGEFKKVLELILAVYPKKTSYFLYFSGAEIDYNPDKGLFSKISAIRIGNKDKGYTTLDISKKSKQLVSIAANAYMIGFFGNLKKMSFGLVNVQPKNADGSLVENDNFLVDFNPEIEGIQEAKEWLALYNYVSSFSDTNGNGIPDIPEGYRKKQNPMFIKQ